MPQETQGNPKCQMRTTFRSTSDTSSRNSSVEQKSCAAENLVRIATVMDAETLSDHAFRSIPVAAEHLCTVPRGLLQSEQGRCRAPAARDRLRSRTNRQFRLEREARPGIAARSCQGKPEEGTVNGCASRRTRLAARAHEIRTASVTGVRTMPARDRDASIPYTH